MYYSPSPIGLVAVSGWAQNRRSLRLLAAMAGTMEDAERDKLVGQLCEAVGKTREITAGERAKSLLLLRVMAPAGSEMRKAIEKRVKRELRSNPQLFAGMAPSRKPGYLTTEERLRARKRRRKKNR